MLLILSIEVKKTRKFKKQNDIIEICYFLFMFFCLALRWEMDVL